MKWLRDIESHVPHAYSRAARVSVELRRDFERGALGKYANIATPGDSADKIEDFDK